MAEARWLRELRKGCARLVARYQRPRAEGEGERLPDVQHDSDILRLDKPNPLAYVKLVIPRGDRTLITWWGCCPDGRWMLLSPDVLEHEDCTITAHEGREFTNAFPSGVGWTGTLVRGGLESNERGAGWHVSDRGGWSGVAGAVGNDGWLKASEYSTKTFADVAKNVQSRMHGDREYRVMKAVEFESKS